MMQCARLKTPIFIAVCLAFALTLASCDDGDGPPPLPPTGLEGVSQEGAIALSWNAVEADDLSGYNVYRSTSSGVDRTGDPLESGVSSTEHVDRAVENGTIYYYVVTAVDEAGNESEASGEVKKTPFAQPPDRP